MEEQIKALEEQGYVVEKKEDREAYLGRYKSEVEKTFEPKLNELRGSILSEIQEATGFNLNDKEDLKAYAGRIGQSVQEAKAELERLKKENPSKAEYDKRLTEKEAEYKTRFDQLSKEKQELESKLGMQARQFVLEQQYSEVAKGFKEDLPGYFTKVAQTIKQEALSNSTLKDGELYLTDENGEIKKDAALNPIKVLDYFNEQFKEAKKEERKIGGAGSSKPDAKLGVLPDGVTDRASANVYLAKKLGINNPKFIEERDKLYTLLETNK